jgi:hypothetical protein
MHGNSLACRKGGGKYNDYRALAKLLSCLAPLLLCCGSACAACEDEAAQMCSSSDDRCLRDAADSVQNAAKDCKDPQNGKANAALWRATPHFFDGKPFEKQFWRCVAKACADAS